MANGGAGGAAAPPDIGGSNGAAGSGGAPPFYLPPQIFRLCHMPEVKYFQFISKLKVASRRCFSEYGILL